MITIEPGEASISATPEDVAAGPASETVRRRRASLIAIGMAAIPFLSVLWNLRFRPLRTALPSGLFSDFFDIQADAFLRGDLAVPDGSLGFEAFRHDGREFMYFGAWPSLLRMPVMLVTDRLDGRMTALSMVLAWAVAALFTALLVWRVRTLVAGDSPASRTELVGAAALIAVVLGGSPVLFLAALPWVYSEALLWAIAASLGTFYAVIKVLEGPSTRRILLVAGMTLGAVLCRVTAGWGCGGTVLAVAAAFWILPRYRLHRHWAPWMALAGGLPLIVGVAINYAKFGHPILIPFETQVWTDLSQRRRDVLDGGGVTGIRFLPATLFNYLRPDGIRLSPIFPFLTPPGEPASQVGGTVIEMPYRTPSATAVMPILFVLGGFGSWQILRRGAPPSVSMLRIPLVGAASILGGILLVGYIAPRYTVEFVPVLVIAAAAGLFLGAPKLAGLPARLRRPAVATLAATAAFGAVAALAIALVAARVTEGGRSLAGLVRAQHAISQVSGRPLADWTAVGERLPDQSAPDRVFIVGDCDLLAIGTGDLFEPWAPIEMRSLHVGIELGDQPQMGEAVVARFGDGDSRAIVVELGEYFYRIRVTGAAGGYVETQWREYEVGATIDIDISADFGRGIFVVDSPGSLFASMFVAEYGQDAAAQLRLPAPVSESASIDRLDLTVTSSRGPVPSLCGDLRDEVEP